MQKNRSFPIRRQKAALVVLQGSVGLRLAGSVWVLLLAARGFSLVEVGLVEGLFHLVSLCCELPSGMLADVLGRKRTLAASQLMFLASALLMLASAGLAGVCLAMVFQALGWNLLSGTLEAMAYDSLLQAGQEEGYLRFSSLQNTVYRLASGGAMLLAGATLALGYRLAYLLDTLVIGAGLAAALSLEEPGPPRQARAGLRQVPRALVQTLGDAAGLLRGDQTAVGIMLVNGAVGACATLTGFFLQQRVEAAIPARGLLGPALFLLSLGGGLAALFTARLDRLPYAGAAVLAAVGVGLCAAAARGCGLPVLLAAGLLAGLLDDSLQLISDKRLNQRFPSAQRATLISISSMLFSLIMIPLSPVFGWLFS